MVEDIKTAYARLKQSGQLQEFLREHPESFLASFSVMSHPDEFDAKCWQVNYFMKEKKRMTSFVMKEEIEVKPNQEVLRTGDIKKLDAETIKIDFKEAFEKAKSVFSEKTSESAQSVVVVLQGDEKPLWAITFVTASMKMVGIKINALTGEVVDEKTGSFGYKIEKT